MRFVEVWLINSTRSLWINPIAIDAIIENPQTQNEMMILTRSGVVYTISKEEFLRFAKHNDMTARFSKEY